MKAIVLHSGGLDSTVVLGMAVASGSTEILSLGIKYGSKHNEAEARAAEDIVRTYSHGGLKIARRVIDLTQLGIFSGGGRSALMGDIPMPQDQTYEDIHNAEVGESPTVVPYRNGVMISIAAAIAETMQYDEIWVGMHGEDAHNWAYPDCTPEFLGPMAAAIYVGTYHRVRLKFPLDFIDKAAVVRLGEEIGVPLYATWSCYDPAVSPESQGGNYVHCGRCPTCMERKSAFKRARVWDPTIYAHEED